MLKKLFERSLKTTQKTMQNAHLTSGILVHFCAEMSNKCTIMGYSCTFLCSNG